MSKFDNVWVPTLEGAFLSAYEGALNSTWAYPLMRKYDSPGEFLKVVDVGTVGKVRQFTGSRQSQDPNVYTLQVQNLPYEITLDIDADDYRRDSLGMWEVKAAELGQKMADHVNQLGITVMTGNPTCLDGAAYFSASHKVNGTTQSNLLTNSDVASLDVTTPTAPTPLEMSNCILGVTAHFAAFTDEVGDPINGGARNFTVVTGNPSVWASATAAINSPSLASGQTNPLVGLTNAGWKFTPEVDQRLGSTAAVFYVFRTDSVVKPLVWSEELPFELELSGRRL
jgi:hypothetical protein